MPSNQTIAVGFWVAITLPENMAPLRSYVGKVQAVDEHGMRLTLIDWLTMSATGYDLFVPWAHLQSAFIATPEHDREHFGEEAGAWQKTMVGEKKHTQQ